MKTLELDQLRLDLAGFELSLTVILKDPITGLSGPSGSGKTSLLELIAGLRQPRSGRIVLDGTVLSDAAIRRFVPPWKRRIGYVPQDQALFPHWSARRNLLAGPAFSGRQPEPALLKRITGFLELEPLLDRSIHTLSGGEKGRIALGRALLGQPAFLLLDEPLAHLDDRLRDLALGYLRSTALEFGIPMLMVSHSAYELGALCQRILHLEKGRLVPHG